MANRPHFDAIEMKGGGDAVSAARAVLQTGEFDYAWNMQVEDEILTRLEKGGKGRVIISHGGNIEHIQLNSTDPWTEVDGERSSLKTTHPILSDPAVRQALALLIDRDSIQKHIYGRTGAATANFVNNPARFASKTTKCEFNVDKANQILDAAGWKKGADGIRAKDGKKLKFVFQTSINAPRQKTQAIVKQACQKAGIEHRAEVGDGVGVLLVRRRPTRTPTRSSTATCRCTTPAWPSPTLKCSCASSARGRRRPRTTSGRAATHALAERGIRRHLQGRPRSSSTRSSARR